VVSLDLPGHDARGVVVLVSGWRGVGKTTALLTVRAAALDVGLSVGGFLSVARTGARGEKNGIDLMDAATGAVVPLATVGGDGAVRTGHYTFNPAALDAGLRFADAGQAADVFFVDELGPLELERGAGWAAVIPLITARAYGAALVVVRPELIDRAREQLALTGGAAIVHDGIMIDEANRDAVAAALADWVRAWART